MKRNHVKVTGKRKQNSRVGGLKYRMLQLSSGILRKYNKVREGNTSLESNEIITAKTRQTGKPLIKCQKCRRLFIFLEKQQNIN